MPPPKLQTEAYAQVRRLQRIRSKADREAAEGAAATATGMIHVWCPHGKGSVRYPKRGVISLEGRLHDLFLVR